MVWEAFLFYGVFLLLRRYSGGYHADTYLGCNIMFTVIMVLALVIISNYKNIPTVLVAYSAVISFLIFLCYSPLQHKNKQLSEKEIRKYRAISIILSGFFLFCVFLLLLRFKKIATTISLAMLVTACALFAAVIQGRRKKI